MQYPLKVPVVRYVTQPPTTTATTSCLSSRRGVTNNETKATPTQSPTTCHNPLLSEKSPTGSRVSRKHVQFPDTSVSPSQIDRPGESKHFAFPFRKKVKIKLHKFRSTRREKRRRIFAITGETYGTRILRDTCHFHKLTC